MEPLPGLLGLVLGALGGLLVPALIARCPEPEHDPSENPEDYPDHVPFAVLAARPGLRTRAVLACALAGGLLGTAVGWSWALPWLLYLVPVCCALTVIDYVTWYLPSRLIVPSWGVVAGLVVLAAVAVRDPGVVLWSLAGFAALGGYYGLMWLVSPRIMAGGDVRLGALIGLALGPFGPATWLLSVVAAAVVGVLALVPLRRTGNMIRRKVPFGPFLAIGALVAVVVSQALAAL